MVCIRALAIIEYLVINRLIFQPKNMLWVLKRTVAMKSSNYNLNLMSRKAIQFYGINCVYLDFDGYSMQVRYTSVNMSDWLNLKQYR